MNFISYIVTILLFIGTCFLAYLGWHVEGNNVNFISSFYPSFFILLFSHIFFNINSPKYKKINRNNTIFIIFSIIYFIFFKIITNRTVPTMLLFNSICLPILYASFFSYFSKITHQRKIKRLIIVLFILNSLIAIYERFTLQNLFSLNLAYTDSDFSIESDMYADLFRSTALLGHPLTNALITAIIMGFILISNIKTTSKYTLYILGFIALMCFNARASILLSGLSFIVYILRTIFKKNIKSSTKILNFAFVIISVVIIFYLFNEGYGGRFFEKDDISEDSSILARIEVWGILTNCTLNDILWGSADVTKLAMKTLGYVHIENWLILSVLMGGLVITIIAIIVLIPNFKYHLKNYTLFEKLLLLSICLGIASTNNSLACGVPALSVFIVCAYAFKKTNVSNKHSINTYK